jgi:hypothetical protein
VLIVIDPAARAQDGESVRIARDVLCAGARGVKVCVLEGPGSLPDVLARRGARRVVVVGDDGALLRAVNALHADGGLRGSPLAMVPVGPVPSLAVARALGVPTDPVAASRAVLSGRDRRVDVLTDDAGGVVVGPLGIPAPHGSSRAALAAALTAALRRKARPGTRQRLRVEADGRVLADGDQPVAGVSMRAADGMCEVLVRTFVAGASADGIRARARSVTVSGQEFRYRANAVDLGPTRQRTWTVRPGALRLRVPAP